MINIDQSLPDLKPVPEAAVQPTPLESTVGLFLTKSASQWSEEAKSKPIPQMLFCVFWCLGELCILFADTNLGKSILAVQIGVSIARSSRIPGFALEAPAEKVLYFDFELTDKQFEARYSDNFRDHFFTPGVCDNLLRAEINPEAELPREFPDFESYLCHALEQELVRTGARVLIIDNITYLGTDTEKAKGALPLMKHLQKLKKKHGLSFLVLAHTPKRDMAKPITKNDIQGSKMLVNFCDSSFAIGASSQDPHTRYLKQVKQRQTEERYGAENVVLCQIAKPHNFLQFEFIGLGSERDHLRQLAEGEREQQTKEALQMRQQGKSNVAIAAHFGVSEGAVRKWIKKAEESGAPF
ncbi:AAA family ATPase [Pontibacter korlensis]|uniref:LuxR family transcriptional regulator n=1 Tax=Pontibacter korlensis TaxID=400092 RepID=A0A0E3UXJ4_9BACT|nr:AAA family ATPase [Pontibacter korlensis]AKD04317.1 LuxR family transcriptional regulator [Pontibacter korlensis]